MELTTGLLVLLACIIAYFLPTVIAGLRGHRNTMPIFLVNLLFGWMLIGWLIAFIWSFTSNTK